MGEKTEHTAARSLPAGAPVPRTARQRRPTGAPPPLPHPIAISTTAWLLLVMIILGSGIAHRDIKPGNLMVRRGELLLIDVAFVQVRPSPWRQAVDLGNMMLVLAVRTDPERVYRRALRYFTPDELAEAFAATRGVASPTQLRAFIGPQAVTVTLAAACDVSGAQPAASDQPGTRRFERPMTRGTQFADLRFYTFPGGCVTYQFNFAPGASALLAIDVDSAVALMPRATLVDWVRTREGLALCGWGAVCPG